jgi:hypothetical protein
LANVCGDQLAFGYTKRIRDLRVAEHQLTIGASSSNGAMIPAVWGTFRSENNTMLPAAKDPGPWSSNPVPIPSGCAALTSSNPVSPGFQPMVFAMISKFGNVNQASGPPLIEQSGWYVTYDIRLDQSEYTYLQQNGYYNGATQKSVESNSGQAWKATADTCCPSREPGRRPCSIHPCRRWPSTALWR